MTQPPPALPGPATPKQGPYNLFLFGVAGTMGQYLGAKAMIFGSLVLHYGLARTLDERLWADFKSKHELLVSNGERIADGGSVGFLFFTVPTFLLSAILLYLVLIRLLPRRARATYDGDYEGTLFAVGIATLATSWWTELRRRGRERDVET